MSPQTTENQPARFLVGIDLGTTNSALAFVDAFHAEPRVRDFAVPQAVAPGEIDTRPILPSFAYEPAPGEFPPDAFPKSRGGRSALIVGWFARRHGAQTPGRLISSAKSWLCHPGVDRTAALLPWHGAPDVTRISPVEASARYLTHLVEAWDAAFPAHPLKEQEVVVTVPASFDEVARNLTLKAADQAGLPRITLLEEPQAAFYSWMSTQPSDVLDHLQPGELTLICDIGGGTSDFTLIEVRKGEDGRVRFHRVAVGNHLLLGGDNMDLALAHHLEKRLLGGNGKLDPRRWGVLVQNCRQLKETLLGPDPPERTSVSVAGGARLIGGALQTEVSREEVHSLLLDGFFPKVGFNEKPSTGRSGFQEFGLPYVADPAVTRHLASFLESHARSARQMGNRVFPDKVLFNGGVFESPLLQQRLLEVLESWRNEAGVTATEPIRVLPNDRLDLAVARGAAYSALLRRQPGRRIAAGLARAYYVQVGRTNETVAVCVAPAGLEENEEIVVPQRFLLRLRQPVEFVLFDSSTRSQDKPGDVVPVDPEQLTALPPVRTVVGSSRERRAATAEVQLHARLTAVGTLDLRCVELNGPRSWKLEFDVRGLSRVQQRRATGLATEMGEALEEAVVEKCAACVRSVFQPDAGSPAKDPATVVRELEEITGWRRDAWNLPLLRALWEELMEVEPGRRRGVMHEARWLNLVGFCLRPGYGYTVDDWRVQQTWKLYVPGTVFPKNEMCRAEWLILWRRIAAGLGAGHQRALMDPLASLFRSRGGKKVHRGAHETAEAWRLLGSLEWLPVPVKVEMGSHLVERLERRLEPVVMKAAWWALGRIGARVPAYGPLNTLVPVEDVEGWVARLISRPPADAEAMFAVVQMARATGDRYRDLGDEVRASCIAWLEQHGASSQQVTLVREGGALDEQQEQEVFGESLPPGLHLGDDT